MAIFTIKRNVSLKRFLCPDDTSGLTIIGENGAHRFVIHSLDAPFDGIVTAYFVRSDGTTVFMEGEIVGGMAVVVLHEDCYHVTGKFDISIFITKDGKSTCVYKGKGKVVQYRTDTVDDSGQIIDLGALIEVVEDYKQATLEAQISAGHAADSEANAKASEDAAKESELNAAESERNAKISEEAAEGSAASADESKQASAQSSEDSKKHADRSEVYYNLSRMQAATGGFLHLVNKNGRIYCVRTANCGLEMRMVEGRLQYGYTE